MHRYLDDKMATKDTVIDNWLKDVVFLNYVGGSQGFICPGSVSLTEADSLLRKRGFHVTTASSGGKAVIWLSLPPRKP